MVADESRAFSSLRRSGDSAAPDDEPPGWLTELLRRRLLVCDKGVVVNGFRGEGNAKGLLLLRKLLLKLTSLL